MSKYGFLALSIDKNKLYWKMIRSLYEHYDPETIGSHNFHVICQGYSAEDQAFIEESAPDLNLHFVPRESGTISEIRKKLLSNFLSNVEEASTYDYLIFIDDDFKFGPKALEQYDHHILELDSHPEVGFVACQRRMNGANRVRIDPIEIPYPQDLAAISMRNGLIFRMGIMDPQDLFDDRIIYHEEFYMALQVYLRGYEIGKAWVDVYHQSRVGGLGNSLQNKYHITENNDIYSSKRVAHESGWFSTQEGVIYYSAPNTGKVSTAAHEQHTKNKEILGL